MSLHQPTLLGRISIALLVIIFGIPIAYMLILGTWGIIGVPFIVAFYAAPLWEHHRRTLDVEFAAIQDAAGIDLACPATGKRKGNKYAEGDKHECTDACHRYGFHDERRAFATLNAPNMTREALQSLMRHANPETTARYINMAKQLNPAVQTLQVPAFLTGATSVG